MEEQGRLKKSMRYKKIILILCCIFLVVFSAGLTSAWDFDNVVEYSQNETEVSIVNFFGLGRDLARIKLLIPYDEQRGVFVERVEVGEDRIIPMFVIDNYEDVYKKGLKKMKIINMKNGQEEQKEFQWVYAIYGDVEVDTWEDVCVIVVNASSPTGESTNCREEITGTHIVENQIIEWRDVKSTDLQKGSITIGIKTDVKEGDYYDGIPTLFGKEIKEWAVWEATVKDSHGQDLDNATPDSEDFGMIWKPHYDVRITSFTISAQSTATVCAIDGHGADNSTFAMGTLVGTNCSFSTPFEMTAGEEYYLKTNSTGVWTHDQKDTADPDFPLNLTNGQYTDQKAKGILQANAIYELIDIYTQRKLFFPVDIIILSPANSTYNSEINHTLNATTTIGEMDSCWFTIDRGVSNATMINDSFTIWNYTEPSIFAEGGYLAEYFCNDSSDNILNVNVSFTVDTTNPDVNITFPINKSAQIDEELDILYTRSDPHLQDCWYSNDTYLVNTTLASCGNITTITWSDGNHNVTIWANDSVGNVNHSRVTFNMSSLVENSQTYSSSVIEKSSQTFSINVTYDKSFYLNAHVKLKYNNTDYTGLKHDSGGDVIFNTTITVPEVTTKTNITFYWEFTLTDSAEFKSNSTFKNQTVNIMGLDDCSTNNVGLYNFTIFDEGEKTFLVGSTQKTYGRVHLELYTLDRSTLVTNYSQNFTEINPFSLCINDSLGGGELYSLDAQIQYGAENYSTEFYHMQHAIVNSDELTKNISLYALGNASSTVFSIIYKDENFLPLANALIQIQRKYVDDGIFRTVEIPKTDSNGQTIAHLEEEDVVYTFIVVKNGEIEATFNDFLVKCEDPVLGTCEIDINAFKSHLEPENFINLDNFLFTLTYDDTTRTIQSIYTIPTGEPATVSLNTTLADGLGTTVVCSDSLTSASGTLSCVVPIAFGNATIINTIYKDGDEVARGMVGLQESPEDLYGRNLMFLGFFLMITLIGVGLGSSPMVSGIFLIIGAILSIAFNLVSNTGLIGYGATILWLIIAVIIILMKGARRE